MPKHLFVCSGGGHLKQLATFADRLAIAPEDQVWVTFDTGLSRSLLRDRETVLATYAGPKDAVNIVRNLGLAWRVLGSHRFAGAYSTGSSIAVDFLPIAARRGVPSHYIESAARASGPSLTGRILSRDRRVSTYTQYPAWANDRWQYRGSIFDEFAPGPDRPVAVRKAVVTVGTTESYGFDRLLRPLSGLLADLDVLWQTGVADTTALGIPGRRAVPHAELDAAVAGADVVIAHAGTGAALTALEHGKCPVLVPRRSQYGEHVDDHQIQIAEELARRGLAVTVEADALDGSVLQLAANRTVQRIAEPPRFELHLPPHPFRREVRYA